MLAFLISQAIFVGIFYICMLINIFIVYYDFGSMPTVNVFQIKVYEIHSLSALHLFLPCKTKTKNVLPLAVKFMRHHKDIQRISYCSS
jgi:hypothetical protein